MASRRGVSGVLKPRAMGEDGAIRILRSPVIPDDLFWHGFPERTGGVSEGTWGSLNLSARRGDDPAKVAENFRRVATAAGYEAEKLAVTKHVHGNRVWRVGEPLPEPPEFDGLVSDRPGAVLGAFAADCMPVLFADPEARICGACHAGWRGTVADVGAETARQMIEIGAAAERIRVAIGPSIGPCCFEVGPEVVAAFTCAYPELSPDSGLIVPPDSQETSLTKKPHVDLRRAMRAQLERIGVDPAHIDDAPPCTMHNPERFFSYRRDGAGGGCHMGFIGLRD